MNYRRYRPYRLEARKKQHSHTSEVYAINAAGSFLTDEILDFVKTGK
jgi:hypothetical protein